jgi:hypothetical protein
MPCRGNHRRMERQKGEYLDMDEDKRQELDQQAEEYVEDVPGQPAMNADSQEGANATPPGDPDAIGG